MDASILTLLPPENTLPAAYWNQLSQSDKTEFLKLRNRLHQSQKTSVKDRRLVSFSNEMTTILRFLEQSESGREQRCILAGVAFAGPFICVNTRQLKSFLGRCKSSINGSFQQLGYVAVRTKSKAKTCVLSVLPSLSSDPNLLRQWTVRGAADDALFCFVSKFQPDPLPVITADDLNEERKIQNVSSQPIRSTSAAVGKVQTQSIPKNTANTPPIKKKIYDFDLSLFNDLKPQEKIPEMTPSYSVDYLSVLEDQHRGFTMYGSGYGGIYGEFSFGRMIDDSFKESDDEWAPTMQRTMSRSQSVYFSQKDWSPILDSPLFLDF
ncbi:hypothetical protein TRFO_03525 [Tritrichomonas foetus]|uniref:Initiator binding domain-containing protein n=1 Tax=Tritrichomonas foetus TaxID=1144522 RepID=A0A1J4KTU6_9EUKA|nr:hypothetical protein TRFO_03525 [Tritrichomonas foetus]|eukprot:OHT13086.1 hypothetical protein TRFO_03525 [Tritrichomonas foetus]